MVLLQQTNELPVRPGGGHPAIWLEDHVKQWADSVLDEKLSFVPLRSLHGRLLKKQKPLDRTLQFWTRSIPIYVSYKFCQLRTQFCDKESQEKVWEDQHEWAADKVHSMFSELGGFFLKVAQLVGKPDLAPDAWVRKLVTLCDAAPSTPFSVMKRVLERELGVRAVDDLFEEFHEIPIGSASVAQVHRARIKGSRNYVAVKVQHPGVEELMMTDIRNLRAFAAFVQRFDLKFDMLSVINELEEQVGLEFDFEREARSMDRIANSFSVYGQQKRAPVMVPRPIPHLVTRQVLVMEFMEGIPILQLGEAISKRGFSPNGAVAELAKRNILKALTEAYGHMILKDGFFHADPHPGNILINDDGKIALLDYGQVKELPNDLRLKYAKFVLALHAGEPFEIGRSLEKLGVVIGEKIETDPAAFLVMASGMFDTTLPPGHTKSIPFGEGSTLEKFSVKNFPKELFFVLRTVHLLRGLSVAMDIPYSCAAEWKDLARQALCELSEKPLPSSTSNVSRELSWKRSKWKRPFFAVGTSLHGCCKFTFLQALLFYWYPH
ncbi:hypothetical protein GOP47_0024031 [Adiantum capillus-veneris]|uniref:Protein kinase domain-containing protein n=1 Tax=Adiantum capillus-veneris TaxID=13818 RepID=A0A9D4Z6I1_ADICA|nr:hypothetical protein GOP47_0024031 [Adiantum capillus-veneris]